MRCTRAIAASWRCNNTALTMRDVFILGSGQTAVGEHWDLSLRQLARTAVSAALNAALPARPQALFVANMLAGQLSGQRQLGALLADYCGLRGIEAIRVEAAGASGGAALRQAYIAVASGVVDTALVLGVEKLTDKVGSSVSAALGSAADADWEAAHGATQPALAALIMQRYMHEQHLSLQQFAGFSVNAHSNGRTNPNAMFRNNLKAESFASAAMVAEPVNMFDTAPEADGAAALVLGAAHMLAPAAARIRVAASALCTDAFALADRADVLQLRAAQQSVQQAQAQASCGAADIDLFELHDGFTILAALALEAAGYAQPGSGWQLAHAGKIGLQGEIPISTFGGLKARGNPGGATGVYQAVEVEQQLRGAAGANQVQRARRGMLQGLGGNGATAVTHIFECLN